MTLTTIVYHHGSKLNHGGTRMAVMALLQPRLNFKQGCSKLELAREQNYCCEICLFCCGSCETRVIIFPQFTVESLAECNRCMDGTVANLFHH